MLQHGCLRKKSTFPIPIKTGKQPKRKIQPVLQPNHGTGYSDITHPQKNNKGYALPSHEFRENTPGTAKGRCRARYTNCRQAKDQLISI
jgi:hypothetical protein